MADLELLSNEDLRAKLIEHNLGNIPLTATTRKVLVNKLRKAMNGELPPASTVTAANNADQKTSRRETMHVSQPATEVAPEKVEQKKMSKRRATLDPVVNAPPPAPVLIVDKSSSTTATGPSNSRRSGRITPVPKTKDLRSVIAEPTTYVILDEDEDSADEQPVDIPPPSGRAKRSSRSPSLGKSDTVTTSYQSVIAPVATKIAQPIDEMDQSDDGEVSEYTQNTRKPAVDTRHIHNIVFSSEARSNSSRRQTSVPSVVPPPLSRYETVRMPDINRRRITTATVAELRHSPSPAFAAANSDSDDVDMDFEISAGNTPYLSNFAKRLSCLRAEPLSVGATATSSSSAMSYPSRYARTNAAAETNVTSRRRISAGIKDTQQMKTDDDSLWQSFKLLLVSVEHKIRPVLLLALIVLVVVFVYVFFFTSN